MKRNVILWVFLLTASSLISSLGYVYGIFGDGNSSWSTIDWAERIGLWNILFISTILISVKIEALARSRLGLPFFVGFAIMLGFFFAIMNGAGIVLQLESGNLWLNVLSGFTQGIISGGVSGFLLQKTGNGVTDV